jgi:hypothetical protein
MGTRALSLGVKRPGREADHLRTYDESFPLVLSFQVLLPASQLVCDQVSEISIGRRLLGNLSIRWEVNIKIDLKNASYWCKLVERIHLCRIESGYRPILVGVIVIIKLHESRLLSRTGQK